MKVAFIAEDRSSNSVGRVYCLWLLARHLGWDATVLTTHGDETWTPLRGTDFDHSTVRVDQQELAESLPEGTDLIIPCKPLPRSMGVALPLANSRKIPLLLDIDDPDLEIRMRSGSPVLAFARWARHPRRSATDARHGRLARRLPTIVSNPWLQARYGGVVIPHVRPPLSVGDYSGSSRIKIAFVGTNAPHKGVAVLRSAVAEFREEGGDVELTITDLPPSDAAPWERWVGRTTLAEGLALVRRTDVVILPSLNTRHARGQLPVKLIDAMLLGRPVIVSAVPPLPWAIGDTGVVARPGDVGDLLATLRAMRDPLERRRLGLLSRQLALQRYTVSAVAPAFRAACLAAMTAGQTNGSHRGV